MACCKCCSPIIPYFESEISGDIFISDSLNINLPILPETDIDLLKLKVICEYLRIITKLELGYKPDLEFLLEEISLIDIESEVKNREFLLLYYLNETSQII